MDKTERIELLRALTAASNAFHDKLRENGYEVSYGLDGVYIGSIRKLGVPVYESRHLGDLKISWKLKD